MGRSAVTPPAPRTPPLSLRSHWQLPTARSWSRMWPNRGDELHWLMTPCPQLRSGGWAMADLPTAGKPGPPREP